LSVTEDGIYQTLIAGVLCNAGNLTGGGGIVPLAVDGVMLRDLLSK